MTFPEETFAWRLQFLRHEKMLDKWELKTELHPTETSALATALSLLPHTETYANISIKRITGDDK